MKAIVNTKLILEEGIIWDGVLLFEGGRIVALGEAADVAVPEGAEIIDAGGLYTAPGLINTHVHGCNGMHICDEPEACAKYLLARGETTVLATMSITFTKEQMIEAGKKIRAIKNTGAGRIFEGIHMEGPYMNGLTGGQTMLKWPKERGILKEDYIPLVQENKDLIRMWAVDPDREGIEEFLEYAKKEIPGIIFAYGHSTASMARCRELKHYGFKVRTHITDSGQTKGRAQGVPAAGGDQFSIYDPDMYAEMICDQNGIHVEPEMMKFILKPNGIERTVLITDSVGYTTNYLNNEELGIKYGPDLNYDVRGYLNGSRLSFHNAVKNLMHHTGYGLCQAIHMASLTPARMLGIDDRLGSLLPGKTANMIIIDDMVNVKKVFLYGELVAEDEKLI